MTCTSSSSSSDSQGPRGSCAQTLPVCVCVCARAKGWKLLCLLPWRQAHPVKVGERRARWAAPLPELGGNQRKEADLCEAVPASGVASPAGASALCLQKLSPFKKVTCSQATREKKGKRGLRGFFQRTCSGAVNTASAL